MSMSSEAKKGYLFFVFILAAGGAFLAFRGGPAAGGHLLEVVPRDAVMVAHIPDVVALGSRVEEASAGLGLDGQVGRFRQNVSRQMGFDPLDPVALRERGLRPEAGIVLYAPPPGRDGVAVLSVRDAATFETSLLELVGARTGATRGEDREVDGVVIHVAEARNRVMAAWTYRDDVVLISAGRDAEGRVAAGAASGEGRGGIRDQLWFKRGEGAVGEDAHLFLWVSGEGASRAMRHVRNTFEAAALGLNLEKGHVATRVWAGLDGPRRNAIDPFKVQADASDLLGHLDPSAMAAGRLKVDLQAAWSLAQVAGLPRHLDELTAQLTARGIRFERDVLPLLEGTVVMDLGMAGQPDLGGLRRVDPRRLNPFLYVRTSLFARLDDAEKAEALMPDVAQSVSRAVRGRLEEVEIEGRRAYEIHYRLGKGMTFGIVDDVLVVAGGEKSYPDAMARVASPSGGLADRIDDPEAWERLAKEGALALLVHVPNLVATVEGLPSESFGGGPTGMMLRSLVERFVAPVSQLTGVTATFTAHDHGVLGQLDVGYAPAEAPGR
jgi:hypothetical protein